ncbi:TAXI family TRAP transporter solute-binding subunit [Hydrocarboniclastica marina]|uniref:C4-dicarboxylate ABC transporter substrate-binding protein n=1 Tax=Hydrocarboniclastica marina TaxID=2259620 RepID=A0A4P7XGV0_9ALTE|nr:TAXI family TRAP transporter solute-binding subunit [Hydrocarboniclastica marina]MAL97004.1 C4-dicarboxylate ABC transporter substrate-binding protein [Alteromonadaceae bacterium]QCF25422.1 C4-dicarboxylate ABC transporter substrate-binding protein [Hydrocarboniclastica marina]|tara:strand:- start:1709 stop:2686 length:978 start_codon:yes stop_codon:yes gene_type:complete
MTLRRLVSYVAISTALGLSAGAATAAPEQQFVTIGTGGVTGVYYPAGGAICQLVNRNRSEHGIRCSVESTGGSIYNLNAIREGELDLAVAQSDWQHHAYSGSSDFESTGPNKKLRSVFSMHPEPFTVVARRGAEIENFKDLEGKRVNVGNPGSGQRATAQVLMEEMGWSEDKFSQTAELKASEMSQALCDNRVDAFFYVVGHPSGSIKEAMTSCDSELVDVDNDAVDRLVEENPYYRSVTIPGDLYGESEDTKTFGVAATIVSSTDVPDEVVYQVVKAVFENFDRFRSLHPAFANLKKSEMVSEALSAPLHPGAAKYYKEVGLLK